MLFFPNSFILFSSIYIAFQHHFLVYEKTGCEWKEWRLLFGLACTNFHLHIAYFKDLYEEKANVGGFKMPKSLCGTITFHQCSCALGYCPMIREREINHLCH
jgi:hypothetical protein